MNIEDALINRFEIHSDRITVAGDGGTIGFELIDSDGETHQLFIDRRTGTTTCDHLYASHYPADERTIHLGIKTNVLIELRKAMS
jgi:hypothetical protein